MFFQARIFQCFNSNHCGGNGQHTAEENAVHHRPAQSLAQTNAQHHHAHNLKQAGQNAGQADFHQLVNAKFQPHCKHQKDYANFRPQLDIFLICNGRQKIHHRAAQKTSQNIAQHQRLFQLFA